ncbi:succinate dehydrogenase assembly factor 2, mitochondrial-like isoform X2 [Impatiens glandulifera]|uniref:succinate dehydrogenase assembly factor 2, mitochondrial-like isoform X2 n=1 Tax=Impatiens glandulifera TaxID=253017 RepID=UPI001FB103F4|nr:succinate dehydrogenase assembly factor 2, mitochondrial-like isoform X2 [Impatiens glandulifera]
MALWRRALPSVAGIINSISISSRSVSSTASTIILRPTLSYFSRLYSSNEFPNIDLSNEESKRQLFNRLLYRSKQRGFLELDLVLGGWVEDHLHSLDANNIKSLLHVLDLENPDLWKWLTGQEQPPESISMNPVFSSVQEKVKSNLKHVAPETRAMPGQPWVRGWDDFKKGRDSPITGNQ